MSIAQVLSKVGGGHFTSSLAVPKDLPATVTGSSGEYSFLLKARR